MTFGIDVKRDLTGADVAVRATQIAALLPVAYLFVASGYPYLFTHRGLLSFLFDLGCSALPRVETLALSWAFRATGSDLVVYFGLLVLALAYGLLSQRLLRGRTGRAFRVVLAVLIAADLAARLLPRRFNGAFGTVPAVLGLAVRLGCLVLILLDLRAHKAATAA